MVYKYILLLGLCGLVSNCNISNEDNLVMHELKMENDSLKIILAELSQKYIFDSISLRDIPSHLNTYEKNSIVKGEIVFVGYSLNKQTNVILADSIFYSPDIKLYNPDTLSLVNGGFIYEKSLKDSLNLKGMLEFGNSYGKSHQALYNTIIKVKDR